MFGAAVAEVSVDFEEAEIERARGGDEAAIDWILARYRQRVMRLATHVLRRPDEAEDVAQEAFVRAFRNLRSYRGDGRFYTWLYQIVVRICLDHLRSARRRAEAPLDAACDKHDRSHARTVDDRLTIEALLDRLDPPVRAILVLRELEGLEYDEIAETLEIPVGRVKWRLHAARAKFQELWQASERETRDV